VRPLLNDAGRNSGEASALDTASPGSETLPSANTNRSGRMTVGTTVVESLVRGFVPTMLYG
jgi:hypothetical protein